jgi:hypothetical protein
MLLKNSCFCITHKFSVSTGCAEQIMLYSSSQSQSHIATDGQSISKSWCRAPSGAHDQILITVWQLRSCFCGAPSLTSRRVYLLYMLLALASVVFFGSELCKGVSVPLPSNGYTRYNIVTRWVVHATKMTCSNSDDWIYYHLVTHSLLFTLNTTVQRYRWYTHFPAHLCTRTRILCLH